MATKKTNTCKKCLKEITVNNFNRHVAACCGPVKKKVRGIDFDPNIGFKNGLRQAWNKGIKMGPNISAKEYYNRLRKITDTEDLKCQGSIRRKVLEEQDYKCNRCGIQEWMGEAISLELDHKDGIKTNNKRANLECLCPNCHSLTPTWRGKDRSKISTTTQLGKRPS